MFGTCILVRNSFLNKLKFINMRNRMWYLYSNIQIFINFGFKLRYVYRKIIAFFGGHVLEPIYDYIATEIWSLILFLVLKLKHNCSCNANKFALTFCWPRTKQITGTKNHNKLMNNSSCHVQRVLVVATKVEQGTIRVITGYLISIAVTQRTIICHHR